MTTKMYARAFARAIRFSRFRLLIWTFLVSSCVLIYSSGVTEYSLAVLSKFDKNSFVYPLDLPDFPRFIKSRLNPNSTPYNGVSPINSYPYSFSIINKDKCRNLAKDKDCRRLKNGELSSSCRNKLSIAFVIKSAIHHFSNRQAIRRTWGFEDRLIDVDIKRLFIVGSCSPDSAGVDEIEEQTKLLCQDAVDQENQEHHDIIQGDFVDSYYNNTIKTMMAFKWLNLYCSQVDFVLFVDDDYYVSPKNLIRLVRQFKDLYTPNEKVVDVEGSSDIPNEYDFDDETDTRIYAGYVFKSSIPRRDSWGKWYVPLSHYPYDKYPPYVNAGAYLVSRNALVEIYTASQYVAHFVFDDIYLGLICAKINLDPINVKGFHYYKKDYNHAGAYKDVITSHGYSDPKELENIWDIEKSFSHV